MPSSLLVGDDLPNLPASGRIASHCGAADTWTGLAFTRPDELFDFLRNDSEL
jgi:hypothetical protein